MSTAVTDSEPEANDQPPLDSPLESEEAGPSAAEVTEARRYSDTTLRCTLADMALDVAVLAALAVWLGPAIDRWLASLPALAGGRSMARLAALAAAITAVHALASLPLSWYAGFVVEHRFGLSTQTPRRWAINWLKKSSLTLVFLTLLYTGLMAIIWAVGAWWWWVAAVVFFVVSAVLGQLAPVVLLPLFYKVEPLDESAGLDRLRQLAQGASLAIEGVFRLGMSADTTKANAMLAGMGSTRRVLLGDTLLDRFTPEEIDIVFAHELGHHVHRHLPKMMAMTGLTALAGFFVCDAALGAWTGGLDPAAWPVAALPKAVFVLTLFAMLVGPVQNLLSRRFEREADRYAVERTGDVGAFRSAFLKLARLNKAELSPPALEVFLLHSHPPIRERLELVGASINGVSVNGASVNEPAAAGG